MAGSCEWAEPGTDAACLVCNCNASILCAQITTFATCLAQASTKDANYAAAMVALEQAEREVASCKISFPPRIAVVDRKMRVVSGRHALPGQHRTVYTG